MKNINPKLTSVTFRLNLFLEPSLRESIWFKTTRANNYLQILAFERQVICLRTAVYLLSGRRRKPFFHLDHEMWRDELAISSYRELWRKAFKGLSHLGPAKTHLVVNLNPNFIAFNYWINFDCYAELEEGKAIWFKIVINRY